jgi:hypothetical protein
LGHPGLHKTLEGPKQKGAQPHQGEKNEKLYAKACQTVNQSIAVFTGFRFSGIIHPSSLWFSRGRSVISIDGIAIQPSKIYHNP